MNTEYHNKYYKKNLSLILKQKRFRKRYLREWLDAFKVDKKCVECGENHPGTLQFHHVSKNKIEDVSQMVNMGYSQKNVMKEIEKCIILCANCHSKKHWLERVDARKKDPEYDKYIEQFEKRNNGVIDGCVSCGISRLEADFREKRKLCLLCYNRRQKDIMEKRRKTRFLNLGSV